MQTRAPFVIVLTVRLMRRSFTITLVTEPP